MKNVQILVNTKTNKIFEAFSREQTKKLIKSNEALKESEKGLQDYINVAQEKSLMSSDEDFSQQKAPEQVSKVSYTQSERMKALGAHLAYGKLHFFSELVLNEGSLGAVEHRVANDHLTGEELSAVKKFVKRQGRPNMISPAKL